MKRTLSIGSRVPPALTSTRSPLQRTRPRRSRRSHASEQLRGLREPADALLALGGEPPVPGLDDTRAPLAQRRRFACVAGCSYMRLFIAGAITSGQRAASAQLVSRLSAMPAASLAIVFAEAGAIRYSVGVRDKLEVADRLVRGQPAGRERRRARDRG